jgi:hypothetical protein
LAPEEPGVLDLLGGVGDGPADMPVVRFGYGEGVGGALGHEGSFHLGEQARRRKAIAVDSHAGFLVGADPLAGLFRF